MDPHPHSNGDARGSEELPVEVLSDDCSRLREAKPRRQQIMGAERRGAPRKGRLKSAAALPLGWPTRAHKRLIVRCAGAGMPQEATAKALAVPPAELRNLLERDAELRRDWSEARSRIDLELVEKAVEMALGGDRQMLIFLLKSRVGLRESSRVEITGAEGGPVKVATLHASMSEEQMRDLYAEMVRSPAVAVDPGVD